ncbi:hypothetical protein O7606_16515 [Micromonospora sp. WMMD882]|uniref:hypothetical protein n=1 Tax=Micromonospora sp. WMMD882 TaxID=3015151 RepID=UPI00248D2AF4|nr:hypothetical protein [Micromonospora sp. WMMD882]WBB77868.1 hypothetical protein O7606_16515 [Micromonospora sp. WMMD882]
MGRLAKTLVATTIAVGGMFAAAAPAQATGSGQLVDISVGDIVIHDAVSVDVAALLCGFVDVNALVADLNDGDNKADCLLIPNAIIKKH